MARERVTISIPAELLHRIDAIAEARGDSRSHVMWKVLEQGVEAQEQFVRDLENPVVRGVARLLTYAPVVTKTLNRLGHDEMSREELDEFVEALPRQVERGKARSAKKKRSKRS